MQQSNRPPSVFGCLGRIIAGIVVMALLLGAYVLYDAFSSPWAYSFFGPTLTGEWVGSFTSPSGQHGVAYLNLSHPFFNFDATSSTSQQRSTRSIEGSAQSCMGGGAAQGYQVWARPDDRGGNIHMTITAGKPFVPGYALKDMTGAFSKGRLTLSGTLQHITDAAGSTKYDSSDVNEAESFTVEFHKASLQEFKNVCQSAGG